MIAFIVKVIVSLFLSIVAIILFGLWLVCGTLFLIALLLRFISLYTIALLNSFVSGNPLTQNYTKAIEEVIDMYIFTYAKVLSMPTLPWIEPTDNDKSGLRALLPSEIAELKKSWAITLVVFISYIFSFGSSISLITYVHNDRIKKEYQLKLDNVNVKYDKLKSIYDIESNNNYHELINTIKILYVEKDYPIDSIARFLNYSPKEINKIIKDNKIKRKTEQKYL